MQNETNTRQVTLTELKKYAMHNFKTKRPMFVWGPPGIGKSETFEQIKESLENGNDIKFSGFGNFILRNKSPRPGRNPKTGEEVTISERRVVTFKSGLKLKSKLEAYDGSE